MERCQDIILVIIVPTQYNNLMFRNIRSSRDQSFHIVGVTPMGNMGAGGLGQTVNGGLQRTQSMEEAVCSVDEIETMTGMDFFPSLDDTTERRIEANASLSEW